MTGYSIAYGNTWGHHPPDRLTHILLAVVIPRFQNHKLVDRLQMN